VSDRGFIEYAPRTEEVKARLKMIQEIIEEYRDDLPLTMRQIFYRCVAKHDYDKTERAYKNLLYISRKARRSRLISFADIRDDGVTEEAPFDFTGLADFSAYLLDIAETYQLDRQMDQDRRLIVLCEAGGMVPQLARVAKEYGVKVQSSGGYDGLNPKHDLAVWACKQPTTILHIGDLDPSGEDMFTVISEDVKAFASGLNMQTDVEVVRVAVTATQATDMELPTAPAKETDSRTQNFIALRTGSTREHWISCSHARSASGIEPSRSSGDCESRSRTRPIS
jgi:rhodanese-related sulfurtransferase